MTPASENIASGSSDCKSVRFQYDQSKTCNSGTFLFSRFYGIAYLMGHKNTIEVLTGVEVGPSPSREASGREFSAIKGIIC